MYTNPILSEKYRVQKEISESSKSSVVDYSKKIHAIVEEVSKERNIKFQYGE